MKYNIQVDTKKVEMPIGNNLDFDVFLESGRAKKYLNNSVQYLKNFVNNKIGDIKSAKMRSIKFVLPFIWAWISERLGKDMNFLLELNISTTKFQDSFSILCSKANVANVENLITIKIEEKND